MADGPLSVLRHRNFRIYWSGQAISLVGMWMQMVAQAWVIADITGDTTSIATVNLVSSVPMIALSLGGGVVADRFSRRRILMLTQCALAGCAFVYGWLVGSGHLTIERVYMLAVALGIAAAFDLPAQQALVPELVPPPDIPKAISLNQALFHGSRLLGPALAGLLMAVTTTSAAFYANGVSYFAVIISLAIISAPPAASTKRQGGMAAFVEGLGYLRSRRDVRALIGFTGLTTAFVFPFLVVFMAITVKTVYHGDEMALGVIMASSGFGAMAGSLALTRVSGAQRGRVMTISCALAGLGLCGLSLVSSPWAAAALVVGMNVNVALALGLNSTILQITVPNELRGRVMSVQGMMFTGLMPITAYGLGQLADQIGMRLTIRLSSIAYVVLAIPWLVHAGLWRRSQIVAARAVVRSASD
jgi:MFS family permease